MPKIKLTPIKQKSRKEEVQEITQNPDDPLAKYPLRAFGYSNEVGAAVSAMPVWGKTAEALLWVPALMYLGADIYDKYKRGKDGDYTKASAAAAVEQATFQGLASVLLPTAAVKMGQSIAGSCAKFDGTKLTASAKEETFNRLLDEFDNYNFAKGDVFDSSGNIVKGIGRVKKRIIEDKLKPALTSTRNDLKTESLFSKVVRFFAHSKRPVASSKANENDVIKFIDKEITNIFDKQTILENSSLSQIEAMNDKKLTKLYKQGSKNADKLADMLLKEKPEYIIKKILNSSDPKHKALQDEISKVYDSVSKKRLLVRQNKSSAKVLAKLMNNPNNKETIEQFAKRLEISRYVLRKYIKGKSLNLGLLKTAGGFVALACLAVPIDKFVHKYIIKKLVEPGIENVENFQNKMSFKGVEKN